MLKDKIVILFSGNLADVSPGGIAEYVSQFIQHSQSEVFLLGTENKESGTKLWEKEKRDIGGKEYTYIPINFSNRKPISVFYFIHLIVFILFNINFWRSIKVIYAQRMEYVLPFTLLFPRKQVVMAIHGSGRYATMFWGKYIAKVYLLLEKISIKRSTKVFILNNHNDYGVPYYKRKYSKYKDKIFYTLVPVNMDLFKPMDKSEPRKRFGFNSNDHVMMFFGRIENNPKRVYLLPEILKKVKIIHPTTKLLVVGTGGAKQELMESLNDMNLLSDTVFIDHIKHGNDLVELVNCADLSIVCSSFEGICMSALESISSGVPVIATNVGDIKEYLQNGVNGYLVDQQEDELIIDEISNYAAQIIGHPISIPTNTVDKFQAREVISQTEDLLLK
ncbi:glycosyltransferase [Robertmurraya sp. GLU-23]